MKKTLILTAITSLLFMTGCSKEKQKYEINTDGSKSYYLDVNVREYSVENKVTEQNPSNEVIKQFGEDITISYYYEVKKNKNNKYDHIYKINIKDKLVSEEGDRIILVTDPDDFKTIDSINKETIDEMEYFVGKFTIEYDTKSGHIKKEETHSPTYVSRSPSFRFYVPRYADNLSVTYEVTKQYGSFYLGSGNTAYYTVGTGTIPGWLPQS